jgi:regulator of protease activity HflC (stomatin/prohibitin superfamily)
MIPDTHIPDYSHWRSRYSAESQHWNDLKQIGAVLIPVLLLLFVATIAAVGYAFLHAFEWTKNIDTRMEAYWFSFRLAITYLSPLLIAIAGIILLYRAVINYATAFYGQAGKEGMFALIQRRLLGKPPLPPPLSVMARYPFVVIKEPQDLKEDHWVRWLGGPATLVIYDGVALYLERGGRFARVVGPGSPPMPFLDRHETVKAVVDLRPQVKTDKMKSWTKDGIQIEMDIRMECQLNASEKAIANSRNLVYPFDPIAVKEAVEYTSVKLNAETGRLYESGWLDGIWGQVTGFLARHISCHSVDEIALAEIKEAGESEGSLHTFKLAKEHIDKINGDLANRKCGAHVANIHITLTFPKEVEDKRIEYWRSERDKLIIIRESKAEANGIRIREQARAKAERDVLDTILERLKRVNPDNLTEPLLLSLTGVLDSSLEDPMVRSLVAKQSLDFLEKLREALKGF